MIADTLSHAPRYAALHPAFAHAFAWLTAFDAAAPDGNHPIGMGCEARVMSYVTGPAESRRWESHRRYIDIQFVVKGRERMDAANIGMLRGATPYDDANDVLSPRVPVAITNGVVSKIAAINDAVTHMIGVFI